jgi:hypothetical protein
VFPYYLVKIYVFQPKHLYILFAEFEHKMTTVAKPKNPRIKVSKKQRMDVYAYILGAITIGSAAWAHNVTELVTLVLFGFLIIYGANIASKDNSSYHFVGVTCFALMLIGSSLYRFFPIFMPMGYISSACAIMSCRYMAMFLME